MNKFKRILALLGIIALLAMYGSTLLFALLDHPGARSMLMGSVYCTIVVPVFLYAVLLAARVLKNKNSESGD